MAKQTLWIKRRTSRGGGRAINNSAKTTAKNIDRDIRKNQLVYSHYLLKFTLIFVLGMVWVRLGINLGPITVLPIGLVVGLVVIGLEKLPSTRKIEMVVLCLATVFSYFLPIGLVL